MNLKETFDIINQSNLNNKALVQQLVSGLDKTGDGYIQAPIDPVDCQWDGLARDLMMWIDLSSSRPTPRKLFDHLDNCGRDCPDWIKQESEMCYLDEVVSKSTRCVLIYKAMILDYSK